MPSGIAEEEWCGVLLGGCDPTRLSPDILSGGEVGRGKKEGDCVDTKGSSLAWLSPDIPGSVSWVGCERVPRWLSPDIPAGVGRGAPPGQLSPDIPAGEKGSR